MTRWLGIAACALALAAGAGLAWWLQSGAEPRPDFALPDLQGETRHVSEWDGHLLLINFWATWCAPCREEIPMLVAAQRAYRDRGVRIIGLALDRREPVERFAAEYGINYPVLVDAAGVARVQDAFDGGTGLPMTILVDRRGRIRERVAGELTRTELDALLAPYLD
ncbi:redoxin domain-containing protein [Salinisphaera sp. PC39]|uniref:TlpA family protein disulfide reductase n=1 Tax=Salinisphaera sp. PC39 TaxID=1304156 RepID=UPI003341EEC0